MKKNISINISGIIFHIEEDGYEQLKKYLDSISDYFSGFKDAKEIISDIEGRIAEIFLSKLSDIKQVITSDDVQSLISTMGSIEDFQAVEDPTEEKSQSSHSGEYSKKQTYNSPSNKELKRDNTRKLLGGVCAGVAAYFNIDPIWIRLLTVILTVGSSGIILIVYLVMWAILPASDFSEETQNAKKMFRNPEEKVLAGVASGVATYFGVDVNVVRVLFVVFAFFGGTGILAYLILWIILPEAKSITERVQMKGEPVTLSNIETNIKKSLNVKEDEEENLLVKVLLFPFRLIATVIGGLGKAFGPLMLFIVDFIRVAVGIVIAFMGISFTVLAIIVIGIVTGILSGGVIYNWTFDNATGIGQPIMMFFESIPTASYIVAFLVLIIPCILFILLGISVIAKKVVFNAAVGWSLFGIFIISAILLSINIPGIVYTYHEESHYEESLEFPVDHQVFILKADRSKGMNDYEVTDLYLKGHKGKEIKAVLDFTSRGISREDAINNAKKVKYDILKKDSVFWFDYNISFEEDAPFKFQELDVTFYMPYNQPFIVDKSLRNLLSYRSIERYGYQKRQLETENQWVITESGLECLTCDKLNDEWTSESHRGNYSRIIDLNNFNSVLVNSSITVEIRQGDTYKIELKGEEDYINDVEILQNDDEIEISFNEDLTSARNFSRSRNDLKVMIYMPELIRVDLNQASKCTVRGFEGAIMEIEMNGASFAEIDADIKNMDLNLNGSSKLKLQGKGEEISVVANGNSDLDAYSFRSRLADVSAHGASTARLYVSDTISINRDIVSSVRYRGGGVEK